MPIMIYIPPLPQDRIHNVYLSEGEKYDLSQYQLVATVIGGRIELTDLKTNTEYWVCVAELYEGIRVGAFSEPVKFKTYDEGSYSIFVSEDGEFSLSKYKNMGSTTSNKFKLTGLKENSVYWVSVARTESGGEIGALSLPQKIITEPKSDGIYEVLVSEMGDFSINNFRVVATTTEENYNKKEKYYKTTIKGLESGNKYWVVVREKQGNAVGSMSKPSTFIINDSIGLTTVYLSDDNITFREVGVVRQANYFRFTGLLPNTTYYAYVSIKAYNGLGEEVDIESNIFSFETGDEPSPITLFPYDLIDYDTHILENSVKISTDNQLIINQVNLTYYNRRGLLNRNDFTDVYGELKYIKYKTSYDVTNFNLIDKVTDENNNTTYLYNVLENFHIDDDVNKIKINEMVSLFDNDTGYEILGKIVDLDVKWKTIDVYLGYEVDRALQVFGKTEYLYNQGYGNKKNFTLKIRRTELPIICKYARSIENATRTEFLKYPLIPHLDYEFYLKFSVPESNLYNFTNLIEEIDGIYGTFDNSTIKYGNEFNQEIPLYIASNKIELKGNTKQEHYITYNTYDNSNLQVKIEQADDNESDLKCTFINTIPKTYPVIEEYPISTQGTILRVDNIDNFNVGDCLMLHEENASNPAVKDYYNYNSNNRYTVVNIFKEDGNDYIILDGIYPIGNEQEQLKYIKYDYREVIHLQSFYIRGNPVIEDEEYNLYENLESIEAYGTKSIDITGRIVKKEDLSKIVDYYMEGFNGIDEKGIKFVFPIEIVGGLYDIRPLDIIEIEEPVYTGLSKQLMLVVSKKVRRAVSGMNDVERTETYELFPISGVDVFNDKIIKTIPRQNINIINKELDSINENDKKIQYRDTDYGIINVERIEVTDYKASVQTTINGISNSLEIKNIVGDRINNNGLITKGKRIILRIGNEFILAEGQNNLNGSSTTQLFKVIKRNMFNTGETQITVNQDVIFYKFI